MKKKIIMGLFVLAAVIGMGFAEETRSTSYYYGYNQATRDYSMIMIISLLGVITILSTEKV